MIKLLLISALARIDASTRCADVELRNVGCSCETTHDNRGVYVNCQGLNLMKIPANFPENTRALDLSNNQIDFINELPDMNELVLLNLTNNQIRSIHYDAFDGLDSLTTLSLSHNQLSSIDDDIFEWNPLKLKRLYLDNNRFEHIQHFLFYDLVELEEISLKNNSLFVVHPHAFTELENLKMLDLSANNLVTFQNKWVRPLLDNNLYEVHLDNNPWHCDCALEDQLNIFSDDQFSTLLQSALYRGRSELLCQNKKKMMGIKSASELTVCSAPKITGISKSTGVESGKSVLLKCIATGQPKPSIEWRAPNDDVYRLTSDDFEGITVHQDGSMLIEDIRLADSGKFTCIAKNKKGTIEAKTEITVTGKDSVEKEVKDPWEDVDETKYNVRTKELEQDGKFFDQPGLGIELNPKDYEYELRSEKDCPKNCDCSSEMVDCSDAGEMPDGSPFRTIPARLPSDAKHLDLNVNEIQEIGKDVCRNYPHLQELKLDENKIDSVHESAFSSCKDLRILTLRNNKLTKISLQMFYDLSKVEILVLDNNDIQSIPEFAFRGMEELQYLYFRENRVNHISVNAFHQLKSIRFIHLEDNQIQSLEHEWIKDAADNLSLKRIFLDENKISCDSKLKAFKDDISRASSDVYKVLQPNDIECSYPIAMAGTRLTEIKFDKLVEVIVVEPEIEKTGGAGFMIGGIFLGIVLTALIFVVWRKWNRRHSMRHGLYSYQDIHQEDNESRALTADQEAFI